MKISEVIKELEKSLYDFGDVKVEVRNEIGEFNEATEINNTHYRNQGTGKVRNIIYIDS